MSVVKIVPYQARWPEAFQQIAAGMRQALGDLAVRIDHIGSTAVPGLAAKDLIDVQITVLALSDEVEVALNRLGYMRPGVRHDHVPPGFVGEASEWEKWFFREPEGSRMVNTHVRVAGRANQRYPLLFRDYLRAHPQTAEAYGRLKQQLAIYFDDSKVYTDVKDPAVDLIYLPAEVWASAVGWVQGPSDG